jgi:dienelactone hydrolase
MNGGVVAMYFSWLDRWDERRMRRRDDVKKVTDLALDPGLVFPANEGAGSLDAFCAAAERAALASDRFFGLSDPIADVGAEADWLRFRSCMSTGIPENDNVHAKVTKAKSFDHAVIVFHHWNASSRNQAMAGFLARHGLTVAEIAMPYHLERSRPGSSHADYMLSPNLGRTLQAVRQAVIDGRQLVRILQQAGYRRVSVLGTSLGSWVAGLVAAHDPAVGKASLLLSAGSLADMVWTGGATRHIRASLDSKMLLADLRHAWAPLDLGNHVARLARPGLDVQIVLAERDRVVLPALSEDFVRALHGAGASLHTKRLNCGHYSLTLPPYAISTGINVARFLKGSVPGLSRDVSQLTPA